MNINKIIILILLITPISSLKAQNSASVFSPNGDNEIIFSLNNGKMEWSVNYKKQPVILKSDMGILSYVDNLSIVSIKESSRDTVWTPVYGERSKVTEIYNCKEIELAKGNNKHKLAIEIRAYDEGVAFRYKLLEAPTGGQYITINGESTNFTLPEGAKAWFTSRAQGSYKLLPLSSWPDECERPLTVELPNGLFVCLTEAEMVDYSRTKFLLSKEKPNTIACSMYGAVDEITPFATPWRVVMVAEKPGQLLQNNDLILNLNPPCALEHTWWIKPGKVMREVTLSMAGAKELVDFAVKRNIQYIHFDAGWYGYEYTKSSDATTVTVDPLRNPNSDLNIEEVVEYANKKGVGVFLYVNQRALVTQLDKLLPLFKSWGISGIKFGFVQVGSHRWTTWMHEAIKKCAEYNLMVDIHDEYRPTGFSRTYPNLMTQEGICGNEEMPTATHNTILPFTRFIAGAADYTICYYHRPETKPSLMNSMAPRVLKTTSGHQLALSMIYYSPLQFMYWYDKPSDSQDEPELSFFDAIHTVWDDTKVLDGKIGEYVSVARRSGDDWFVGTITNNDARTLKLPLDFLPEGVKYEAYIYSDDATQKTRTKVAVKQIKVDNKTELNINLIASGGQAIRLIAVK